MVKINNNKNEKGLSLIDLMVGLTLSSFTVLGIFTIYAQFEIQKRTTVQVGETTANAALAMFPIRQDAKIAGYGISNPALKGCQVKAYSKTTNSDFTFTLVPVLITKGADNTVSDTIAFMSGNSTISMMPIKLTANTGANNANIKVENKMGFGPGDLIILAEPGKDCNMAQVSGVQGSSDVVLRNTGNYTDPVTGEIKDINYNKPGGLDGGLSYSASTAMVINIGSEPQVLTYSIVNNQLRRNHSLTGVNESIADNVVLLKAKYGLDANNDNIVEQWTGGDAATDPDHVKAIKVALIAKTPLKEQKIDGACIATTNSQISWDGEVLDLSTIKMNAGAADPDWGCYRYRVVHSVIPMRNLMWGG